MSRFRWFFSWLAALKMELPSLTEGMLLWFDPGNPALRRSSHAGIDTRPSRPKKKKKRRDKW